MVSLSDGANLVSNSIEGSPFPKFDRLETGAFADNPVEKVTVVTRPWGLQHTIQRAALGLGAVTFFAFALLGCWFRGRNLKQVQDKIRFSISWQGVAIAAFLFVSAFFVPPYFDDGWVIARVRNFTTTGVFSNLYDAGDAWFPQGNSHELVIGFLVHLGLPLIWLRIFVILLLTFAWELMRKFVLVETLKAKQNAIWVAASFYAVFTAVWVLSLRAEAWVVVFSAIAWAGFLRFKRDNSELALFFALIGAGISLSEHQSGWVAVPIGLASVVLVSKRLWHKRLQVCDIITPVVCGFGIFLINQFILFGPNIMLEGIRDFSSRKSHAGSFSAEIIRYRDLFSQYPSARVITILLLGLFVLTSALVLKLDDLSKLQIWGLVVVCLLAISFTSSKWLWHFGVYSIPAIVLIGIFFSYEENSIAERRPFFLFVLPGSALLIAMCSAIAFGWSYLDLINKTWNEFADVIGSANHRLAWLLLVIAALGIAIWSDFGRGKHRRAIANGSLLTSFLILPVLSFGWIGYDSLQTDASTYTKQNFKQFIGKDVCNEPFFVTTVIPLTASDVSGSKLPSLLLGGYPKIGNLQKPPGLFGVDVWGTEIPGPQSISSVPKSKSQLDAMTGEFAGPNFAIDGAEYVGVVISTGDKDSTKFFMQFFDQVGNQVESREVKAAGVLEWEPRYVKVPTDASAVRMVISDEGSTHGSWGAASAIYKAVVVSQTELGKTGNFFVGSFENQKYACIKLARPSGGVWPNFNYITQEDSFFALVTFGDDIQIESRLCGLGDVNCFRTPLYVTAEPKRVDH